MGAVDYLIQPPGEALQLSVGLLPVSSGLVMLLFDLASVHVLHVHLISHPLLSLSPSKLSTSWATVLLQQCRILCGP